MKKLRACFVGIGSIAKRHIKNFYQVCQTNKIELEVDAFRRTKTMVEGINMVYTFRVGDSLLENLSGKRAISEDVAKQTLKSLWPLPMTNEAKKVYRLYTESKIYTL